MIGITPIDSKNNYIKPIDLDTVENIIAKILKNGFEQVLSDDDISVINSLETYEPHSIPITIDPRMDH
jgi:hypothetical protein